MTFATPLCPYFGTCGGCASQDVAYDEQTKRKKEYVMRQFSSLGVVVPEPALFVGEPYGYRNRMDFVFASEGVGLRKKNRWQELVQIKRCEISNEKLNKLLKEVWEWAEREKPEPFDVVKQTGTFKYAVIRTPDASSSVSFIINADSPQIPLAIELAERFARETSAENVVIGFVPSKTDMSIASQVIVKKGSAFLTETIAGIRLRFSNQAFFQNNTRMAGEMVKYCQGLVADGGDLLVDLYGGAGTFGVSLAGLFKRMTLIESDSGNVESAKHNITANGILNAEAICADAQAITAITEKDVTLITDPPRAGMHPKVMKHILTLLPRKIVYVSCNPEQMAKEVAQLREKYSVKSLAVFDLFPQTSHVEAIAELVRN